MHPAHRRAVCVGVQECMERYSHHIECRQSAVTTSAAVGHAATLRQTAHDGAFPMQVLDVYMPSISSTGNLLTTQLNFTSVVDSPYCVADWVIYKAAKTWVSTNFYFLESAQTSEITPGDLWIHQATRDLVKNLRAHRPTST